MRRLRLDLDLQARGSYPPCPQPLLQRLTRRLQQTMRIAWKTYSFISYLCLSLSTLVASQNVSPEDTARDFFDGRTTSTHTNNWAVLVCSSRYWFNYRVSLSWISELIWHLRYLYSICRTLSECELSKQTLSEANNHPLQVSHSKTTWYTGLQHNPYARGWYRLQSPQ